MKVYQKTNSDKYGYSGYSIGLHECSKFSLPISEQVKNVIIFYMDNSFSVRPDNRRIYILILGEGPIDGLDNTLITAEAK